MSNLVKFLIAGVLVVVVIGGVVALTVLRAPQEASQPIEAIPLAASTAQSASASAPTEAPAAEATSVPEATSAPAATTAATDALAATEAPAAAETAASPVVLQIVQEESEARFVIDEVLNNAPVTVVGRTNQVAGEIAVDPSDPTKSQVGVIQVNARTLATDNEFRNRAIKNAILQTDQHEFVTFTPTQITGLPASGAVGETYSFQMAGELTIRDVTRDATFDVTVTPSSDNRLEGTAQTTIRYADYGITIPQVRQVASVEEDVRIEIDFVATAGA